jgi:hypothetical protein
MKDDVQILSDWPGIMYYWLICEDAVINKERYKDVSAFLQEAICPKSPKICVTKIGCSCKPVLWYACAATQVLRCFPQPLIHSTYIHFHAGWVHSEPFILNFQTTHSKISSWWDTTGFSRGEIFQCWPVQLQFGKIYHQDHQFCHWCHCRPVNKVTSGKTYNAGKRSKKALKVFMIGVVQFRVLKDYIFNLSFLAP